MNTTPPPQILQAQYQRRFGSMATYRQQVWSILTSQFFQEFVPVQGSVLDLGCGWGEFINQIKAVKKFGMDLNPHSRERLDPSVTFLHQDCSTRWPLEDGALDLVFTSNFFEHLPSKDCLEATLRETLRCLKPGGRIICLGPNIKCLPGTYWDFWDHHVSLTELSLKEILELTGFQVTRCESRFLPYTMADGFHPPLFLVALYLKMPFLWRVFGKQFLVVGAKP